MHMGSTGWPQRTALIMMIYHCPCTVRRAYSQAAGRSQAGIIPMPSEGHRVSRLCKCTFLPRPVEHLLLWWGGFLWAPYHQSSLVREGGLAGASWDIAVRQTIMFRTPLPEEQPIRRRRTSLSDNHNPSLPHRCMGQQLSDIFIYLTYISCDR